MKGILIIVFGFVLIVGCKQQVQPIKWEKPGDELAGEWVWEKGTTLSKGVKTEITDYGTFIQNPSIKASFSAVFLKKGLGYMIYESTNRLDTSKIVWTVKEDTLEVMFVKDKRITKSIFKVIEEKLIINHLVVPQSSEEFSRY